MNTPKSTMSSSTMETLKICQNLGLSVSIIEGDSSLASPVNIQIQKTPRSASQEARATVQRPQLPGNSPAMATDNTRLAMFPATVPEPRSLAAAQASTSPVASPAQPARGPQVARKPKTPSNIPQRNFQAFDLPRTLASSKNENISSPVAVVSPVQSRNIVRRSVPSGSPIPAKKKCLEEVGVALSEQQGIMPNTPQAVPVLPQVETRPASEQQLFTSPPPVPALAKKKCTEEVGPQTEPQVSPTLEKMASSPQPVTPQKESRPLPESQFVLPAPSTTPANKKEEASPQPETSSKTFDMLQAATPQKETRPATEQQHFALPVPSPISVKKKVVEDMPSEQPQSKSVEKLLQQPAVTPQREIRPAPEPQLFHLPTFSPAISITPVKVAIAPKVAAIPVAASITCKVLNDPVAVPVKVALCPHCKGTSRNLARCDNCKHVIAPGATAVYQTVRRLGGKQKANMPQQVQLIKNFSPAKDVIYPALMQSEQQETMASIKVVMCPSCKNPSRNLNKCDSCKQAIPTGLVPVYQTVRLKQQKPNQPLLVKNFSGVGKQIIYPSLRVSDAAQLEQQQQLRLKQGMQNKMVVVASPQVRPKPKPRTRRRYVEPVCLTISSDEEETMNENFSPAMPEESSSLPYHQESDSSKSPNSSPSGMVSQDQHDSDDQAFPGVTDIHGNPGGEDRSEMDYEEDEEADDYGMDDDMEDPEEEDEDLDEEELEEEEEDFDDEVPPDEDPEEEEEQQQQQQQLLGLHLVGGDVGRGARMPICCRSVRIGSFKVHPRNGEQYIPIYLSDTCFTFQVPTLDDPSKMVTVILKAEDIHSTLVHFGRCLPIMFVYTSKSCAEELRKDLHMTKSDNQYYDPFSGDEKQKWITFLVDTVTDDHRNFLRMYFPGEAKIKELDQKTANEILVRSTPNQAHLTQLVKCQPVMYQQAQIPLSENVAQVAVPAAIPQQQVVKPPPPPMPVTKILTYPPPPQTGGIAITSEDMACLNEGEFLNDAIIDFFLKYVFYEKLSEFHRERTHIFSSYFYPRLTQKPLRSRVGDDEKKTAQVKRHGQVRTWTRHVDIFSKDYIIIPINQNVHWFLAIVCFPGRVPEAPAASEKAATATEKGAASKIVDNVTSTNENEVANNGGSKTGAVVKEPIVGDEGSNPNPEENSNSGAVGTATFELEEPPDPEDPNPEVPDSSTHPDGTLRRKEMPCICIFDSLSGPNRWRIASTLREYLEMEWKIKKGTRRVFDRNTMQGFVLRCPQQTNFSDCGLYVLQYVESFFENPLPYFGSPMPNLSDWFTEACVAKKREQLKTLILFLQKRHHHPPPLAAASTATPTRTNVTNA